ncbi:MAG: DUF362 domain-containing protein [Candidatus Wallbacteria bacterium]
MDKVILVKTSPEYPDFPYEETKTNNIFDSLKQIFFNLDLDKENYEKDNWNPFKNMVSEGGTVLIKPNWVLDCNPYNCGSLDGLITHTSLIKVIVDYVLKAINFKGKIIVGDSPLQSCNFDKLIKNNKVYELFQNYSLKYKTVEFIIEDWRITTFDLLSNDIQKSKNIQIKNYKLIDLKKESLLNDISDYSDLFRVSYYNSDLMKKHHNYEKNEYLVTGRIFEADFIVNIPKMKTHIKAGITGGLKNLVGINGHKEFLPHHIKGSYFEGGDNYINSSLFKRLFETYDEIVWRNIQKNKILKNKINFFILNILKFFYKISSFDWCMTGSWSGNETIWRTTLDLNHILYFYDQRNEELSNKKQRNVLTIIDGIISGEGEGPLTPVDKKTGLIIGSFNPALTDAVQCQILGYNLSRVPTVYNALYNIKSNFVLGKNEKIIVKIIDNKKIHDKELSELESYNFKVPYFWRRAKKQIK